MNSDKTIVARLMDFAPVSEFRKGVDRYNHNNGAVGTLINCACLVLI